MVALFALNINVTSGTLYGPLFYANILVVNATIFFSQTGLAPLEIIVSIINLDLGFLWWDGWLNQNSPPVCISILLRLYSLQSSPAITAYLGHPPMMGHSLSL